MSKLRVLGTVTIVCFCIAFVFLTDIPQFLKYKKGDIKDFETVAAHELEKGDLVQGTIDFTDGCIAEMETTNKTFGVTTSKETTKRYYAVYMYNENYILYETGNSKEYATLDRLADECEAYYQSLQDVYGDGGSGDTTDLVQPLTTLEFTGEVKEMPSDLAGIFEEWYGSGFDSDCEAYMITHSEFSRFAWVIYAGAGAAVLGLIMAFVTFKVWRNEKNNANYGY